MKTTLITILIILLTIFLPYYIGIFLGLDDMTIKDGRDATLDIWLTGMLIILFTSLFVCIYIITETNMKLKVLDRERDLISERRMDELRRESEERIDEARRRRASMGMI